MTYKSNVSFIPKILKISYIKLYEYANLQDKQLDICYLLWGF